jgi:hypothetical protein
MTKTEWRAWLKAAEQHEKGKGPAPEPLAYADVLDLFLHADEQERWCKDARKGLRMLVDTCAQVLKAVDRLMKSPPAERGKIGARVAEICNVLEWNSDSALSGLGIDVCTSKPYPRPKRLQSRQGSPELKRALAVLLPESSDE